MHLPFLKTVETNAEKGKRLEQAVKRIEGSIIQGSPVYLKGDFEIGLNKIVVVQGVKHEIDVWVKAHAQTGEEAIFIFECRNRKEKVNKNDIIVFSEKVRVTTASRGFFVGKAFTKDALAQIALNSRLQPLIAEEIDPSSLANSEIPFRVNVDEDQLYLGIETRENIPFKGASPNTPFVVDGKAIPLHIFIDEWRLRIRDLFPANELPTADYPFVCEISIPFEKGQVYLDGIELVRFVVTLQGVACVERAMIVSAFDIQSRGRTFSYAFASLLEFPGGASVSLTHFDMTISDDIKPAP